MPSGIYKHKPHSERTKRKISNSHKGLKQTEEHRRNNSLSKKGKKFSEETRRKMSLAHKGGNKGSFKKNHIPKNKGKSKYGTGYCIDCGIKLSKYTAKRCSSCAHKYMWQNKEYKEKILKSIFKGYNLESNKLERQLNKLLQQLLPNEYKFVGNGKMFIAGFVPDFINITGQNKIIELYGDYWHNREDNKKRDKLRLEIYKKYGYKTLIIWEHELKNLSQVKEKIKEFNNG